MIVVLHSGISFRDALIHWESASSILLYMSVIFLCISLISSRVFTSLKDSLKSSAPFTHSISLKILSASLYFSINSALSLRCSSSMLFRISCALSISRLLIASVMSGIFSPAISARDFSSFHLLSITSSFLAVVFNRFISLSAFSTLPERNSLFIAS